jgi:hypothetical protein
MSPQSKLRRDPSGPSRGIIAWRRFVLETLLCIVLLLAILLLIVQKPHDILCGPAVVAFAGSILRILRNGGESPGIPVNRLDPPRPES